MSVQSSLSHEENEAITDPLFTYTWSNSGNYENGDMCAYDYVAATGTTAAGWQYNQTINGRPYMLQAEWSNSDANCVLTYHITNPPQAGPTAAFSYSPTSPIPSQTVSFNGSASSDSGSSILSYTWQFGDNTSGTGVTISHAYNAAGSYTAMLTIRDARGVSNSVSHTVTVTSTTPPPSGNFTYNPLAPITGQTITFSGAGLEPSGSGFTYYWYFNDTNNWTSYNTSTATHVYSAAKAYTVYLSIYNSAGVGTNYQQVVTVSNGPPPPPPPAGNFTYSPASPTHGQTITFNGRGLEPAGSSFTYYWYFNDSTNWTSYSTPTASHIYSTAKAYTVYLSIYNSAGVGTNYQQVVTVR